jgi:aminopeptidase
MSNQPTFTDKLQSYADRAVQVGVGLQAGQRLIVRAPVEGAPLARLITESAYRAGARLVDVMWHDDALLLARFQYAPRDSFEEYPTWRAAALIEAANQGDAVLSISASDPNLLKEQDPELVSLVQRVSQTHLAPYRRKGMADEFNWSIISMPIAAWAARVFPQAAPAEQIERLWEIIFKICRIDQPDPVAAWRRHQDRLNSRRDYLNARSYTTLKYTAPGTALTVGLPERHRWNGAASQTPAGISFIANVPTEEVFTMPHLERVEGVVASTRPLSYGGVLIENFSLTLAGGRVVKVTADRGERVLQKLVETDEGAARLGEVALVPHSSPISQSGLLFYNTLFDENASNHLALGKAYRFCLENGPAMSDQEFAAAGGNDSLVHVDFMIGSAEMDIDGLTGDGLLEPVMRGGEWAF